MNRHDTAIRRIANIAVVFAVIVSRAGGQDLAGLREKMVADEVAAAGVKDPRVLASMRNSTTRIRSRELAHASIFRHGSTDWRSTDHLATLCRGLYDRAARSAAH